MLSAEVSWRKEPGVSRAYTWLSDGRVVGYRNLLTGLDHVMLPEHLSLHMACVADWLATYGAPYSTVGPQGPPETEPRFRGLLRGRRRRRWRRERAAREESWAQWRLDRPEWRIPVDPPHGGWRDLTCNEPGRSLWEQVAASTPASRFDGAGHREARAWRTGAHGEEAFAHELWRVARPEPGYWRYVHSVPVGDRGADIDHVLVGPAGVFSINTKAHRGGNIWVAGDTFMVNGQRQPYARNSRYEGERATRLLRASGVDMPAVRPLIVIIDPRQFTVRQPPDGVGVTTRLQFSRWLRTQPSILDPEQVNAIFAVVRRSDTWIRGNRVTSSGRGTP